MIFKFLDGGIKDITQYGDCVDEDIVNERLNFSITFSLTKFSLEITQQSYTDSITIYTDILKYLLENIDKVSRLTESQFIKFIKEFVKDFNNKNYYTLDIDIEELL